MEKTIIIAIVGASGSGKTTLGRYISEKCGYKWISSYTTRPMREGEVNGVDHTFVSESTMPCKEKMIAYTNFGGYHYWTTFDQFVNDNPNVYIIDEDGLVEMERLIHSEEFGEYGILRVYVERENIDVDADRMKRDDGRNELPPFYYDLIITNSGSLDEFLDEGCDLIKEQVNKLKA